MSQPPTQTRPIGDDEAVKLIMGLMEAEQCGYTLTTSIGPYAAFMVISVIQLATRHPDLSAAMKDQEMRPLADKITDGLCAMAANPEHARKLRLLIEAGWDPAYDVAHDDPRWDNRS